MYKEWLARDAEKENVREKTVKKMLVMVVREPLERCLFDS
jgi:hypothetical protein